MLTDFRTLVPLANLRRRAELAHRLRHFFDARGFFEVQTPVLSRWSIIDRHLDPIRVSDQEVRRTGGSDPWFLQTSPEQSMKRLLACGAGSIYQLGPVFRAGECGQLHNPEFTMAEWYDVGANWDRGLSLLDELCQALLDTVPADRLRFADAFSQHTGIALFDARVDDLASWAVEHQLVAEDSWSADWDDWVNLIFSLRIQPRLGLQHPVLVTHFPASQAALAQLDPQDPRTAERYELFYRGVELANGYHELLHGESLAERAAEANQQRVADGKDSLPVDNPLIDAMRHGIPPACGCALGFDRVVMLACGASRLDEVIAFTAQRA